MKMFGVNKSIRMYFQITLNRTPSIKLIISYYVHRKVVTELREYTYAVKDCQCFIHKLIVVRHYHITNFSIILQIPLSLLESDKFQFQQFPYYDKVN